MELRAYQQDFKREIYAAISQGHKRVLCCCATGGGKTVVFTKITQDICSKDRPVVVCVKRRKLIKQASDTFRKAGIPHGVYMANHPRWRPREKVQICSIDTLDSRSAYPHTDDHRVIVIVDEAHDASPTNQQYTRFLNQYLGRTVLGFTATPYGNNGHWGKVVLTTHPHEIRDMGFLVPEVTYVPNVVQLGSKKYDSDELADLVSGSKIIGDIVDSWRRYGQGRPTIIFAVTVAHSMAIEKAYQDAGIKMVHCDASIPNLSLIHI